MHYTFPAKPGVAALSILFLAAGGYASAESEDGGVDYTKMSPEELAEHLVFEAEGFDLDEKTQEGGTVRDRLQQDELQKACSGLRGESPDSDTAAKVRELAQESLPSSDESIELGDWEKGAELARSGFGYRVGHNVDDHSAQQPGGNCYACHQIAPEETTYGTVGPSLLAYGKTRGTSEEMLRYTYQVIHNPHSYFPCTRMPRFGANEYLTEEQIRDIMAYLLDPESPVNQ